MAVHVTSSQEREKKPPEFFHGRAVAEREGKKPEPGSNLQSFALFTCFSSLFLLFQGSTSSQSTAPGWKQEEWCATEEELPLSKAEMQQGKLNYCTTASFWGMWWHPLQPRPRGLAVRRLHGLSLRLTPLGACDFFQQMPFLPGISKIPWVSLEA